MCNVARCLFNSPQVSGLQPGGGLDPQKREDMSDIESEWCDGVFLNSIDVQAGCTSTNVSVLPL